MELFKNAENLSKKKGKSDSFKILTHPVLSLSISRSKSESVVMLTVLFWDSITENTVAGYSL